MDHPASRKRQSILIVEDSDDDFEATERALKRSGNLANDIYRCVDGDDAIDWLRRQGEYANLDAGYPGLVLLDLNMPGRDGRSVLAEIKGDEKLRSIPVVVLTTSTDDRDVEACYKIGANSYLRKPVSLDGFFEAIARLKEYWFEVSLLPRPESPA